MKKNTFFFFLDATFRLAYTVFMEGSVLVGRGGGWGAFKAFTAPGTTGICLNSHIVEGVSSLCQGVA